jgi:nitrite reductase (NADH) small subunit/3-phenylpropionate/trans-cinnamate dioxygenase ferredoxin subunit
MADFVKAIAAADLAPGTCTEVAVGGKAVALFNVAGSFHAIGNRCVHRGGPLGQGMLEGEMVLCPWHAWGYDVTTGVSPANPEIRVPRYDVKVEDGTVFVKVD